MRKYKKMFFLLLAVVLLGGRTAAAASPGSLQPHPLRVAVLPILAPGGTDPKVIDGLQAQLDQETHIPLNGVLHIVDFVPASESLPLLAAAEAEARAAGKRVDRAELMEPVAEQLRADIILGVEVQTCYETVYYHGWDGEICLYSRAGLRLLGYDCRSGQKLKQSAYKWYNGAYSGTGTVASLSQDAMQDILAKLKWRELLR